MKLEDLLDYSADEGEKLLNPDGSPKPELIELCKPFWPVTRPDPNKYRGKQNEIKQQASGIKKAVNRNKQMQEVMSILNQLETLQKKKQ